MHAIYATMQTPVQRKKETRVLGNVAKVDLLFAVHGVVYRSERKDISRRAPFSKWPALVVLGVADRAAVTFTTYADPERDVRGG